MEYRLNTIEEAIEDIKQGKVIIVIDDEDRENEGDFVIAARHVTPEVINFMATHGRGLICAPIVEDRCDELGLDLMVRNNQNNAVYETPFTVSVDLLGNGCTTGISASDRSKTVEALINPNTKPEELGRPGHIFPLRARKGGVLRRTGHTEAAIDLSRLAGYESAGVIVEILNEDGTMARLPQLVKIAERFELKIITIEDLIEYRLKHESLISKEVEVDFPTKFGNFKLIAFKQVTNGQEHLALVKGEWESDDDVMVRVHSSGVIQDIFTSWMDENSPLQLAMKMIEEEGRGVIVYINQDQEDTGWIKKLKAYKLQQDGRVNPSKSKGDVRDYGIGAQILRSLGVRKMNLISNQPVKRAGITGYGLEITQTVPLKNSVSESI